MLSYEDDRAAFKQEMNAAQSTFAQMDPQREGVGNAFQSLYALMSGRPGDALDFAEQAANLAKVKGYERDLTRGDWLRGAALTAQGRLPDARNYIAAALARCRKAGQVESETDVLLAWARWHKAAGDAVEARKQAGDALTIADRCEYRLKQADIHNFLAQLELSEGNRDSARKHAEAAKERAFCDGPPHCYKLALNEAERLLEELG